MDTNPDAKIVLTASQYRDLISRVHAEGFEEGTRYTNILIDNLLQDILRYLNLLGYNSDVHLRSVGKLFTLDTLHQSFVQGDSIHEVLSVACVRLDHIYERRMSR